MSNIVEKKRRIVKRSTVAGLVPTAPTSGMTNQIYPDLTWENSTCMEGELFYNIPDQKVYLKGSGDTNILLGSVSGITSFIDQPDTPSTYIGSELFGLRVNSGGTAVEFYQIDYPTLFTDLNDVPSAYTSAGYAVVINSGATGLEFQSINQSLSGLSDVQLTAYTSGVILQGDGVQMAHVQGSDYYVDLTTNQTIDGEKTFIDEVTFSGQTNFQYPIIFSGINEVFTINDIQTDSSFSAASNTALVSSLAIKTYIDSQIFGTALTSNFVTTNTVQSITAEKTFNADVVFNSGVTIGDITASTVTTTGLLNNGNLVQGAGTYTYIGDPSTDNSWRFYIAPDLSLTYEQRIGGVWTWSHSFTV